MQHTQEHEHKSPVRGRVRGLVLAAAAGIFGIVAASMAVAGDSVVGKKLKVPQVPMTLEQMRNAKPAPMPKVIVKPGEAQPQSTTSAPPPPGQPMMVPGWNPGSGKPRPSPTPVPLDPDAVRKALEKRGAAQPSYAVPPGSAPANPLDYANYGPFQRWTHFGNYTVYPRSVIGKLFFQDPGTGLWYQCTGTVVGRSIVFTAGHCVSDGAGNYFTNFVFCPSYYRGDGTGDPHPAIGCWLGIYVATSSAWHLRSDFDRDYACIVTSGVGSVHSVPVGDVTGSAGIIFNLAPRYSKMSFGYPAAPPFPGYHIIQVSGVEWYIVDRVPGDGSYSVYMGNDMTGGASGGPWFLNWEHKAFAYAAPAPDTSDLTDPFAGTSTPMLSGVNSHKRCLGSCTTPPTATQGLFINEVGSPYFFSDPNDADDPADVYNRCVNNGGA